MKLTKAQVLHFLGLCGAAVLGVIADQASNTHWIWAPIVVALAVNLRTALAGSNAPKVGALVLAALAAGSCATTGPVPPPGGTNIVDCSEAALHQATLGVLPAIENALASPDYETAIAAIITSIGGPLAVAEVECAVAWVASKADKMAQATADPVQATEAKNGRAWLTAHPVTFK